MWKQYQETGIVAGHRLPEGMQKWQKLPTPLFTPSTKALVGHDVNITAQTYLDAWPILGQRNVAALAGAYTKAYKYTEERGILILDSKFEIGHPFSLADEVLTPDSSRFTTVTDWQQAIAEGRDPFFFDKQNVREWGAHIQTPFGVTGIGKLDPENDEHLAFVHSLVVPAEVISETSRRYHKLFEMIVGMPLEQYQREVMQIA